MKFKWLKSSQFEKNMKTNGGNMICCIVYKKSVSKKWDKIKYCFWNCSFFYFLPTIIYFGALWTQKLNIFAEIFAVNVLDITIINTAIMITTKISFLSKCIIDLLKICSKSDYSFRS